MGRLGRLTIIAAALLLPAAPAQGKVNDDGCKPTEGKPPVVLVHGTFADSAISWNAMVPLLEQQGFCVFSLDYGTRATGDITKSADQVAAFANDVLARTGAAKLSFVGHSQGGMLPRYLVKFRGFGDKVEDLVGLAPSSHGTATPLAGPAGLLGCTACAQQAAGSDFMKALNAPPEAPPPADYTVVITRYDEVVIPYESQKLAGDTVTNVVLQEQCPADLTDHLGIIYDPVALQWVVDALTHDGPASPAFAPDCSGRTLGARPATAATAPGGGSTTPAALPHAAAPTARLTVTGRRLVRLGRRVLVPVRCAGPKGRRCTGTVTLRHRGRTVAARKVRLRAAGEPGWVGLRLKRTVARGARVVARAETPAGRPRVDERAYRLR